MADPTASPPAGLNDQMLPVQFNPTSLPPTLVYNLINGSKHDLYDDSFTLCSLYKAAALLTITGPVLAIVPAFVSQLEWGLGGLGLMALQLLFVVSILVHRDRYRGLNYTLIGLRVYFLVAGCVMIAYEIWSLYDKVHSNADDCSKYQMYSVCHKRGGVMTTELLMAIFYPGADVFAFICMSYICQCLKIRCKRVKADFEQQIWQENQGNRQLI